AHADANDSVGQRSSQGDDTSAVIEPVRAQGVERLLEPLRIRVHEHGADRPAQPDCSAAGEGERIPGLRPPPYDLAALDHLARVFGPVPTCSSDMAIEIFDRRRCPIDLNAERLSTTGAVPRS